MDSNRKVFAENSYQCHVIGQRPLKQTGVSPREANILAGGLAGMAQAAAWRWLRLGRPVSIEVAVAQTLDLAWNGLNSIQVNASSLKAEVLHIEDHIHDRRG